MKTKNFISLFILLTVVFLTTSARAEVLTVGSDSTVPGGTVSIPITVDIPGNIAGASFTVVYDDSMLTLDSVSSTFFDTFANQHVNLPEDVLVDGVLYDQPLLTSTVSGGTMIAAARIQAGETATTLFWLNFSVDGAADGAYPVGIIASVIHNTGAGYPAPEAIHMLIGALENEPDLSLAYPALATTVVNGEVTVTPTITDVDGDGIDDDWEEVYFPGDLTELGADTDWDDDGYTDLQEYLNSLSGLDINGMEWNPTVQNAPNQTGYNPPDDKSNFWLLFLPAILSGAQHNP